MAAFSRILSTVVVGCGLTFVCGGTSSAEPGRAAGSDEFRQSILDWQGPYGGVLFSLQSFETGLPGVTGSTRDMDGKGRLAGLVAGYNVARGPWVFGIETDVGYGQLRAARAGNRLKADVMGMLRARLGHSVENSLIYTTGGVSFAAVNRTSKLMANGETSVHLGLIAGGGIEHALTPALSARLEYLYGYTLEENTVGLDDMHIIRAGAVYHFSN